MISKRGGVSRYETFCLAAILEVLSKAAPGNTATCRQELQIAQVRLATSPLHFKQIGNLWSVRVGVSYRALGLDKPEGVVWFWIGTHADYDKLIS